LTRYSNILISMFFCYECVIDFSFHFHTYTYFLCISLFKRSFLNLSLTFCLSPRL
jgi:hypothetical protein